MEDESCVGENDGFIVFFVSGVVGIVNYFWSMVFGVLGVLILNNFFFGIYFVMVLDDVSC